MPKREHSIPLQIFRCQLFLVARASAQTANLKFSNLCSTRCYEHHVYVTRRAFCRCKIHFEPALAPAPGSVLTILRIPVSCEVRTHTFQNEIIPMASHATMRRKNSHELLVNFTAILNTLSSVFWCAVAARRLNDTLWTGQWSTGILMPLNPHSDAAV